MKTGTARWIEAVVRAINTHIDNANVCEQGCDALWSIAAKNGKNALKQNKMAQIK